MSAPPWRLIITAKIEHPAALETCRFREQSGFCITYLGVDESGRVDPVELGNAVRHDTVCVQRRSITMPAVSRSPELGFHSSASYAYPVRSKRAAERLRIPPALAMLAQYPGEGKPAQSSGPRCGGGRHAGRLDGSGLAVSCNAKAGGRR